MLSERDVIARVQRLTVTRLRVWVQQGWIKPVDEEARAFSEADAARAALICNLEDQLGFAEEDVPVLLSLIDQIHGLRSELMGVLTALEDLPPDVRATVRMRIESRSRRRAVMLKPIGGPIGFLIAVALITFLSVRFLLGRLPGDLVIDQGGVVIYAPITTAIIVSLLLSLVLWLFRRS